MLYAVYDNVYTSLTVGVNRSEGVDEHDELEEA
jgi:hypothetical protein